MALLLSDRNRKVDNGSRVAMPYKTVVLPSGSLYISLENRLYTVWEQPKKLNAENAQGNAL